MFKLAKSGTFFWPVTVRVPVDGGRYTEHEYEAEFKRFEKQERDEIVEAAARGELADVPLLRRVMVGFRGVADTDGTALQATPETLELLWTDSDLVRDTVLTYMSTLRGEKVRAKN